MTHQGLKIFRSGVPEGKQSIPPRILVGVLVAATLGGVTGCSGESAKGPQEREHAMPDNVGEVRQPLATVDTFLADGAPGGFGQEAALFGGSVDVDADIAVVGAPQENSSGGTVDVGAAYTFRKVSAGLPWSFEQRFTQPFANCQYGSSAAVRKISQLNRLMVTTTCASAGVSALGFFRRSGPIMNTGTWTTEFQPSFAAGETIGSVTIDSTGSLVIASGFVGTTRSLKIFELSGSTWTTTSFVLPAEVWGAMDVSNGKIVVGSGGPANGNVGQVRVYSKPWSSSNYAPVMSTTATVGTAGLIPKISGNSLAVGDRGGEKVHIFELVSGNWIPQPDVLQPPTPTTGGLFGETLDMDGSRMVVGAPISGTHGDANGAAFSFTRRGGKWRFDRELFSNVLESHHSYFGSAISVRGNLALVAQNERIGDGPSWMGAAHLYEQDQLRIPDFNNDGQADLAIGSPAHSYGAFSVAGITNVLRGNGAVHSAATTLTEPGAQNGSIFGARMAWGRFKGGGTIDDNFDDLVVGAPWKDSGAINESGAFSIFPGKTGALGLDQATGLTYDRATANVELNVGVSDFLGVSTAVGDFNADGYDDVAVGASGDSYAAGGTVNVFYGGKTGLSVTDDFSLSPPFSAAAGDAFGWALAAGDFNCDGFDDLAVGAPGRAVAAVAHAGVVGIYSGGASGLVFSQQFNQTALVGQVAEADDRFGEVLLAANFDKNSSNGFACIDLAIGVPNQSVAGNDDAGVVHLMQGGPSPLVGWGIASPISQDHFRDPAEAGDRFGAALGVVSVGGDTYEDLAIGVPGEDAGAGAVYVALGGVAGPVDPNPGFWREGDIPGGTTQVGAQFGAAIGIAGLNRLAVAAPSRDGNTGLVRVLNLTLSGGAVAFSSSQTYQQSNFSAPYNVNQAGAQFGYALSAARPGR